MENIEKIQDVANGVRTMSADSMIQNFSSALVGLESYMSDPVILDLINQIYTLLNALSALSH